ncbi:hypothetical protein Sta7437_3794 [Stanieria cyanosphaera PCC 7437]|uniref:Uncharacterized protein n=1 Tax=Stanieria cyanosphaera (strain ATCC 29371 / PCC 7437) TaxID=111780 RepID=K9XYS7_STAC7|nr:hypothetical protein [Stanieria cyanosphaera]AFZ37281.1 hypothetical protein Sta7437_3794 [Stanieria cyanosphaera PCC 7437]
MSSSNNQDWQRRIEEIEAEINYSESNTHQESTETVRPHVEIDRSQSIEKWLNFAKDWFNNLSSEGRIAVGVVGVLVSFSILSSFLRLISSLVSIAILAGLLYFGYKFFLNYSRKE